MILFTVHARGLLQPRQSVLSCVSAFYRHAEHQLFQSTYLPTSGIVGRFASIAKTPEATVHALPCWLQSKTAFARRKSASLSLCSCLATQANTNWKSKVSSEFRLSTLHITSIMHQPEDPCWYQCSSTVHCSICMRTSTIMLMYGRRTCC